MWCWCACGSADDGRAYGEAMLPTAEDSVGVVVVVAALAAPEADRAVVVRRCGSLRERWRLKRRRRWLAGRQYRRRGGGPAAELPSSGAHLLQGDPDVICFQTGAVQTGRAWASTRRYVGSEKKRLGKRTRCGNSGDTAAECSIGRGTSVCRFPKRAARAARADKDARGLGCTWWWQPGLLAWPRCK